MQILKRSPKVRVQIHLANLNETKPTRLAAIQMKCICVINKTILLGD